VPVLAAGAVPTAAVPSAAEQVDVTTLASAAIDRADAARPATTAAPVPAPTPAAAPAPKPGVQRGPEPVRHKVVRGETAIIIARRYGVTTADLAAWNGLNKELALREGQFLLIPPVVGAPPPQAVVSAPGAGSPTPTPPSATQPLPAEKPLPAAAPAPAQATPPSPNLGATATAASTSARMVPPVSGSIIRDFSKGRNEGVDISAPAGSAVRAAEAGTVAAITRDTDQVPILVLRHEGGLLTVYANVDGLKVEKGQTVKRGQEIAKVRAGNPAFVHFDVRQGLEAVDPTDYIN
jgi:murein DD-endopeptidase MepM/ murein hydrolase activator NlpD